jgi:glycosyltransferase involved in cell wall biosynthesis
VTGRRILLLHEYPGGFGGAERYLELLAEALVAGGDEVAALVWSEDVPGAADLVRRLEPHADFVELRGHRSWPLAIARAARRWRPDVLHWNSVDPFAFRGASWTLLPWGRPSVLTDHLPMLRTGPHWETTRKVVNRRIGSIVVVGEEGATAARAHWRHLPRLDVITNGVRTGAGRPRRALAPGEAIRLLFVGRLTPQKDPAFAIDVLDRLRLDGLPAQLTIVGDGPERAEVEARLAQDGALRSAVELVGFVDDPSPYFAAASVLVLPSRFEGLPFTPLEALADGLPVVLSDLPPHREIASSGGGARVAPLDDVAGWAGTIVEVVASLDAVSRAALEHAEQFSSSVMVDRTRAVYDRLIRR